jgi:hypothetical protein
MDPFLVDHWLPKQKRRRRFGDLRRLIGLKHYRSRKCAPKYQNQ